MNRYPAKKYGILALVCGPLFFALHIGLPIYLDYPSYYAYPIWGYPITIIGIIFLAALITFGFLLALNFSIKRKLIDTKYLHRNLPLMIFGTLMVIFIAFVVHEQMQYRVLEQQCIQSPGCRF